MIPTPTISAWICESPDPGEGEWLAPPQIPTINASVIDNQIGNGDFVLDPIQLATSSSAGNLLNTAPQANQNLTYAQNAQAVQEERQPRLAEILVSVVHLRLRPGEQHHWRVLC